VKKGKIVKEDKNSLFYKFKKAMPGKMITGRKISLNEKRSEAKRHREVMAFLKKLDHFEKESRKVSIMVGYGY
jgi:hypothetical protein